MRADRADTGAAFHCLLQNVWIRAERTQKWLRGEANALLRGGHTVTDPILKSDHSLCHSRQNAISRERAINILIQKSTRIIQSFQTFCKSEKIVNLRTIISPGQFLVSGASE